MSGLPDVPAIRFIRYLFKQFLDNGGVINASALTYTTLFAVVPLMTVSFAMLAAIPSFQGVGEQVQGWVFSNFVPTTGEVIQDYLKDFISQAQKLTAVGVAFLAVTSIMMMRNIEVAFNRIWRVSDQRRGMSSFLLYWAVLSLGPILIGLGILVSSYIASLPLITDATNLVGKARLLTVLPVIMSTAAFTLLYAAVPNCKVPLKNAFIGAVVVAILFESAKRGFGFYATQFPSYELIYGAFAAIPLFLVWIFISWFIILMGCELTRALTVYQSQGRVYEKSHLHTIVGILHRLWQGQQTGQALSDDQLLQQVAGLEQSRWDEYSQLLLQEDIIRRTDQGEFLLSRGLGAFTLNELCRRLPWPIPDPLDPTGSETSWQKNLDQHLLEVKNLQNEELSITLERLFDDAGKV
ncbi:virulence factor BrkB family protein [Neptunomonas sp.]|uniref:virulence factor BrkB family protein n=1 Tax=Neptunomonas sp. TaxID=1971898 RepID=UPI00356927AD